MLGRGLKIFSVGIGAMACSVAMAQAPDPDVWASRTLAAMSEAEKLSMLQGVLTAKLPEKDRRGIPVSAGYVPGVPRLDIPMLTESDASLGVANMGGFIRNKDEATAMPSGLAMGSTWNTSLLEAAGKAMGEETRAKGFNVLLAGGINLVRDPRNGRNFEYLSEDPLLSGVLGGWSVKGIQSNGIISTVKHYLLNAQETGRTFADVRMEEKEMRESDLLAFQLAIEIGDPGSVMCSYNKVNGAYACENAFLLNDVLRRDWKYKGWVMSDWGAVHSVSLPQGLDQESGAHSSGKWYFGDALRAAIANGSVKQDDIDRSVLRILRTMKLRGLIDNPVGAPREINFAPSLSIAQQLAEQGIVLLKNEGNILPIATSAKTILLVGAHADKGVPQGGGSSQVWPVGGAAVSLPIPGDAIYHRRLYMPSSPLAELQKQFPQAKVIFDDGTDRARTAQAAKDADIAIVFAEQFAAEGHDQLSLSLPADQDGLIDAVANANPHTAVVLETGGPVTMPWLGKVGAVMQAWYAGNRGGLAIANILSGKVNPSGHLPITFPADVTQLPNPQLPGSASIKTKPGTDLYDLPEDTDGLTITYPEGSDVGYRWFAHKQLKPLFPFGYGLSYTQFDVSKPKISKNKATVTVTNRGSRPGAAVPQLYLVSRDGKISQRLVAFGRTDLQPGQSKSITMEIDQRLLADWSAKGWTIPAGKYVFAAGQHAEDLKATVRTRLSARTWQD